MLLLHRALLSVGGAAASGFDPSTLTGIIAVFDPSNLSSLYEERSGGGTTPSSVNGVVGTMRDLSGNGNHATATADANRPILRQSGGLYYLEFDGSNDFLRFTATISQPWVRVSSFRPVTGFAANDQVFGGVTANSGALYFGSSTQLNIYSLQVLSGPTIAADTDYVITERHNGASSRVAKNNDSYFSGDAGTTLSGGATIGADNSGNGNPNMRLYGYIQAASNLSDADVTSCREWCASRAGVTL